MASVVIHTNTGLQNQRECAAWLAEGFKRHGVTVDVTADRCRPADVQVVQGPWYCLDYWQPRSADHRVLWLNRCFYGDGRFDLSLGWLRPDGSRDFRIDGAADAKGTLPELKPRKERDRCAVVFADYGRDPRPDVIEARQNYQAVFFRPHPQQDVDTKAITLKCPLSHVWELGDVAIGHSSTVLVEAEINGLKVISSDPLHVVHHDGDRQAWLNRLSWAQWNHEELQRGEFWEHLK